MRQKHYQHDFEPEASSERPALGVLFGLLFSLGFVVGGAVGASESIQVGFAQRHIFGVFSRGELVLASARAMFLYGSLGGLTTIVAAAVVFTLGRLVPSFRKPAIFVFFSLAGVVALGWFGALAWWGRSSLLGAAHSWQAGIGLVTMILVRATAAALLGVVLAAPLTVLLLWVHSRVRMASIRAWALAIVAVLSLGLAAGSDLGTEEAPTAFAQNGSDQPNILLIVVDALRSDRLGCYGYSLPTSPTIDSLCKHSLVYEQAVVQFPATGPSFGSLFTGKYPRRHGLSAMDPRAWIGGRFNQTLAEVLAEDGFATGAVMTGSLTRSSGLARGFQQVYEDHPGYARHRVDSAWQTLRSRLRVMRTWVRLRRLFDSESVVAEAEKWIAEIAPGRPFFLLVHLFDTHSPYDPAARHMAALDKKPEGRVEPMYGPFLRQVRAGRRELSVDEVRRLNLLYDAEVRSSDEGVGRLLQALRGKGLSDSTIVVVTADHGEELYDHGLVEHGYVYNTNLLVPLIIDRKGRAESVRIAGPVELMDLMPTLLEWVGVDAPKMIDAEPLPTTSRSLEDEDLASAAAAFAEADCQSMGGRTTRDCWLSIQTDAWKLDLNRSQNSVRLFDIVSDPLETRDLAERHPLIVSTLRERLQAWDSSQPNLEELRREISDSAEREIEERLRALGYIE